MFRIKEMSDHESDKDGDELIRDVDITGRDEEIILQALATAHAAISSLPIECRQQCNQKDMAAILKHHYGDDWEAKALIVRHVLSEAEWWDGKDA
jgi:hypothetical protein